MANFLVFLFDKQTGNTTLTLLSIRNYIFGLIYTFTARQNIPVFSRHRSSHILPSATDLAQIPAYFRFLIDKRRFQDREKSGVQPRRSRSTHGRL